MKVRIAVVFHSQEKRNTQRLASLVAEGCCSVDGMSVSLVDVSNSSPSMDCVREADGYAFGSPNYFSYMAGGLKAFFDGLWLASNARQSMVGKPFVAFLTYGGGGNSARALLTPGARGRAVRSIERLARKFGLRRVAKSLVCRGHPSDASMDRAIKLGKTLADHVAAARRSAPRMRAGGQ